MKCLKAFFIIAVVIVGSFAWDQNGNELFERRLIERSPDLATDRMARNILEWIQGIYQQGGTRKTRQESNSYLPPYGVQRPPDRPRPFELPSTIRPQNPFPTASPGYPSSTTRPFEVTSSGYQPPSTTYLPPSTSYGYPSSTSGYPSSGGYPTSSPGSTGYPSSPSPTPSFPTFSPGGSSGYPSSPNPYPSFPTTGGPAVTPGRPAVTPGRPTVTPGRPPVTPTRPPVTTGPSTPIVPTIPESTPGPSIPDETPGNSNNPETGVSPTAPDDDDLKHPPHIHDIQVECSKTMMTINLEFNRQFDGLIYSKGFFQNPECRYVKENSGDIKYSFTVSLDSCGTEFINDFEGEAGQAYLENVLVLQNEQGIQEVWDTVRRVRCLWEGNINKALVVGLSVDMLNQEIVTFSGDTASAKLDIQIGKGPFAPAANGLVKIGETMTLVVSVEGDPDFDLQVRDCIARDESSTNVVQLTDERGCILKPKLFGAFQKTKETMNTGASIIAYAYFQAFKFPDVMDLFIECNVELCKTDCEACPEPNQQLEPGRRRRDISYAPYTPSNSSGVLSEPVRMGRGFRVIMPDDLSLASSQSLEKIEEAAIEELNLSRNVCMSYSGFYASFSLILAIMVASTISAAVLYVQLQKIHRGKNQDLYIKS